jgi:hypothetical protein
MNSQDYKDTMRDIKPSKELNDRIVNQILNNKEDNRMDLHKKFSMRLVIICVIILSLSSIGVAASTGNLADAFKGYFKELVSGSRDNSQQEMNNDNIDNNPSSTNGVTSTQNTKPVANDSAFLNTAGAMIEATDTEAGLKLTARGIVGDDRAVNVAIDVETVNGQKFTKEQEDNLNAIHFQEVKLQIDDDVLGQYCSCTRIDDGSESGKATFLIHDIIHNNKIDEITGHKLTITLSNFLHTTNKLEDIEMDGNLYDIYTKFEKPAEEDYQFYSVRSDGNHTAEQNKILEEYYFARRSGKLTGDQLIKRKNELIQEGLLEPLYILPQTSTKVTFCKKYPKLEITNIGIKNNTFTFNMNINDEFDYQYINTKKLTMVNRKTGECIPTTMDIDGWEGNENGKLLSAHFVVFHTITSAEQLKDYYLAIGGDFAEDIINEGKWVLNFNLSYEDTTRSYPLDKKAVMNGFTGTIKSMDLSPLSMKIIYQMDKPMSMEDRALFEMDGMNNMDNIYLLMKDGSKIAITNLYREEDTQNDTFTFSTMFPYIIDLNQINKIVIEEAEILLN